MNNRLTMMGVVPFGAGDTSGKHAAAAQHGKEQAALQEPGSVRERLFEMQASMGDMPEAECPLQHTFAPGVYVRTIFIPAGTVLVGKIHKHAHANILSAGDVSVMTEAGGIERLTGPLTMVSAPGTKRAVYAHTDATWTTIHPTDTTDLDQIEADVIAPTFEDYERFALRGNTMKNIEVTA